MNRKLKYLVNTATSPEYRAWSGMLRRCYNPKDKSYSYYGGRGIGVCDRWRRSFNDFFLDMGAKPNPLLTLERVNNELGYSPDNCKWATRSEQSSNQRFRRASKKPVSPKFCLCCGKEIQRVKPSWYKKKKYCSNRCVGVANLTVDPKDHCCLVCKKTIPHKHYKPGEYSKKKYCSHACLGVAQSGIPTARRVA